MKDTLDQWEMEAKAATEIYTGKSMAIPSDYPFQRILTLSKALRVAYQCLMSARRIESVDREQAIQEIEAIIKGEK